MEATRPPRRALAAVAVATMALWLATSASAAVPALAAAAVPVEVATLASPSGLRISGTITAGRGPVVGAVVTACPATMAGPVPVECKGARTTATGAYSITGIAPGSYVIRAAPPASAGTGAAAGYVGPAGYVAARASASAIAVTADRAGVDLALPSGSTIAGTVRSASGVAVGDAFVEACAADAPAVIACTGTYSAVDGTFAVGGLGAGSYTLGIQAPSRTGLASGYMGGADLSATTAGARQVAAGTTGLAIMLPAGRSVRGTVSLEGAGAAGFGDVLVQACADAACVYGPAAWTAADGSFLIPGLAPGTWTISYAAPGSTAHVGGWRGDAGYVPRRAAAAPITVAASSVDGVDVTLPRAAARITGRATGGGSPLLGAVVVACGAGSSCFWARTDPKDGAYSIALPTTGPWTVGLRAPGTYAVGLPLAWTAGIILPFDSAAEDGYLGGSGFTPSASAARAVVVGSPDRTRPVVAVRSPRPGATGVATTARAVVRFSEPVTGVSATSVVLRDLTARRPVPASVAYDAARRTATLTPGKALAKGHRYQVTVTAAIADFAGNRLAPTHWNFTTRR